MILFMVNLECQRNILKIHVSKWRVQARNGEILQQLSVEKVDPNKSLMNLLQQLMMSVDANLFTYCLYCIVPRNLI